MLAIYKLPRFYVARTWLHAPDHAGHKQKISKLRAGTIVRAEDLDKRWGVDWDTATATVRDAVTLRSDERGVEVVARGEDPYDTRLIARATAELLATPRREKEVAGSGATLAPFTSEDLQILGDIGSLNRLLQEQSFEAGFAHLAEALESVAAGKEEALRLAGNEDFERRLAALKRLSQQVGLVDPPGEPFRLPNYRLTVEPMPMVPEGPDPELWIKGGALAGGVLAVLFLLGLRRWKPSLLEAPVSSPTVTSPPESTDSPESW